MEMSNQTEAIRERPQQIFDAQVDMVDVVVGEAHDRGEVTVAYTHEAAGSVVAQLEGQVLFAKLYNNTQSLDALWGSCMALLGATTPDRSVWHVRRRTASADAEAVLGRRDPRSLKSGCHVDLVMMLAEWNTVSAGQYTFDQPLVRQATASRTTMPPPSWRRQLTPAL